MIETKNDRINGGISCLAAHTAVTEEMTCVWING